MVACLCIGEDEISHTIIIPRKSSLATSTSCQLCDPSDLSARDSPSPVRDAEHQTRCFVTSPVLSSPHSQAHPRASSRLHTGIACKYPRSRLHTRIACKYPRSVCKNTVLHRTRYLRVSFDRLLCLMLAHGETTRPTVLMPTLDVAHSCPPRRLGADGSQVPGLVLID